MSATVTNEGSVMCYTMVFKGVRVVLKVAICKGLGTFLAISPELFYQIIQSPCDKSVSKRQ